MQQGERPPQAHMRRLNGSALEVTIRLPCPTSCVFERIHEQSARKLRYVSAFQPYLARTSRHKNGPQGSQARGSSMKSARLLALAAASLFLAGCAQSNLPTGSARSQVPIPSSTLALMSSKGMSPSDPILIRAYKKESEMEVWKHGRDGRYALLRTLPICRWSGQLGPKVRQGDRQAPEGFYSVTPAQMNPNSAYYLSFDTGFPNAYDRARRHRRTPDSARHLLL